MSVPLSVCILACDEEKELERCIASVDWADEIVVVVDDKSRDGTEVVARRLASRVERRAYTGDVDQKRYCTTLAKHDWILIVDPDEVVSAPLRREVAARVGASNGVDTRQRSDVVAYEMNRATYHLGRWIRHGDFYPDWKLRLFRRSKAKWVGRDPHGRVEVAGEIDRLDGALLHYSYRDLADQVARIQFFSDQAAMSLAQENRKFRIRDLVLRPPARFLRSYVLRQGFRDGLAGFIIAGATAYYVFLKYAKLWERQSNRAGRDEPR